MNTADIDEMWGSPLSELTRMLCPCCATRLADHSLTEATRCGQSAAGTRTHKNKNLKGCQSRLYWEGGVAAKCCLPVGHNGSQHHNGSRKWNDADSAVSAARYRSEAS